MFLIIQFGSRKTPFIKECIEKCGEHAQVVDWNSGFNFPGGMKGIIFSGSPTYLTEVDNGPYIKVAEKCLNAGVPVLGICFGHQVIGVYHGAEIFRAETRVGPEKIVLLKNDLLLEGLGNEFTMAEDHTEGIKLPQGFNHLASSEFYPVEAMKHKEKDIWGVQFHPEVSDENGMVLFRNFISFCNQRK